MGIPQGSILSTLLCSFYLANLEVNELFPLLNIKVADPSTLQFHFRHSKRGGVGPDANASANINPFLAASGGEGEEEGDGDWGGTGRSFSGGSKSIPQPRSRGHARSTLVRFVDDYLFLTTSEEEARAFLSAMQKGFPGYNCRINGKKTACNFSLVHGEGGAGGRNLFVDEAGASWLRWCGMLINAETCEVEYDYSRFEGTTLLRDSISVPRLPGRTLKSKLCFALVHRCSNPLLFDTVINSRPTVSKNIYLCFHHCALKLECLLAGTQYDLPVVAEAIEGALLVVARKYAGAIKAQKDQMMAPSYGGYRNRHVKAIAPSHIRALGIRAFIQVLRKKPAKVNGLAERLQLMLKSEQGGQALL